MAGVAAGTGDLLDLARLAEQAASALDNANVPLPRLFAVAASDLEYTYYTNEREEPQDAGRRIVAPLVAALNSG